MSLQQPVYSLPKLLYAIASKKRYQESEFAPFSIQLNNLYANDKQLARFTALFAEPDHIPTFAFITAFKANLQCLAQAKIPSKLLGLLHLSSEFQLHNQHNWLSPFNLKVTLSAMENTDKGLCYQMTTDFYQQGRLTITNINLMLDKARGYRGNSKPTQSQQPSKALTNIANWPITQTTAWRYFLASGDVNPIHLHPFLAKQLGLPTSLIHGMHNASQSIMALNNHGINTKCLSYIKVEFNRPCYIPNNATLKQYPQNGEYGLFSNDGQSRFLKLSVKLEA